MLSLSAQGGGQSPTEAAARRGGGGGGGGRRGEGDADLPQWFYAALPIRRALLLDIEVASVNEVRIDTGEYTNPTLKKIIMLGLNTTLTLQHFETTLTLTHSPSICAVRGDFSAIYTF